MANSKIPESILKRATELSMQLLPETSRLRYEDEYHKFKNWCEEQQLHTCQVSDETMIVYMSEKANEMKPNTLWSRFSMLKSCLKIKDNIDISNFPKTILHFLKKSQLAINLRRLVCLLVMKFPSLWSQRPIANGYLLKLS